MKKDYISSIFGKNVFDDEKMREYLPKPVYENLKKTIDEGVDLDITSANAVAHAMKEWALERGATHFTHWFQPLTGVTAEKHDSFIKPVGNGKVIMEFSGKELIKGEPDASSFPSGGLRATFEARGYTAWDCTSPAFLKEDSAGVVLCIPTVFCSYTGDALDKKTPLLKSLELIDKQAKRILKLFKYNDVKKVTCSVGPEQEYFLVPHELFMKRQDLIFTGRTLFGIMPPKGQEMDDHYFGTIKEPIARFMKEVNEELWKLGVNVHTQHNESAPAQHENAPIYTTCNIAVDHNQLVMEIMKKVAKRHGLECLLHEKPFKGVNGSGKHNNWSLITDTGKNLLEAGKKPHENYLFLLFLAAIIKAVDENALLLRYASSNPGNDHRLGANEAPPAIISVFLGDQLEDIVNQMIEKGEVKHIKTSEKMNIGVHSLPVFSRDNTDRNRTSPIAFTGNKFEFRMVASSISIADINTVLNTAVADVLGQFADKLEKANDFKKILKKVIRNTFKKHKRVIFNGNGYSKEWITEAERRGLPNAESYIDSIASQIDEHTIEIFERNGILSREELLSRAEINYESYSKTINIEALTMINMVNKLFIPAGIKYLKVLSDSYNNLKVMNINSTSTLDLINNLNVYLDKVYENNNLLVELLEKAKTFEGKEQSYFYKDNVIKVMEELRLYVDKMEMIVSKDLWPVPAYTDLLYSI